MMATATCAWESPDSEGPLPVQFFAARRGNVQPISRLMVAMLREAIGSFQRLLFDQSARGRRMFSEVEAWLMVEDGDAPLRFEDVCDLLGLDPSYLRQRLREWRARQLARAQTARVRARRLRQPATRAGAPASTTGTQRNDARRSCARR
jgi:hypothetical protein